MAVAVLKAPIVLVHGLLGFDQLAMGAWVLTHYFRGIPEMLRKAGNRVLVARLSPTAGIGRPGRPAQRSHRRRFPARTRSPHRATAWADSTAAT